VPLSAGTKLGHYEVVESAGAGGMGEVYRVRDKASGRFESSEYRHSSRARAITRFLVIELVTQSRLAPPLYV